MKLKLLLFGTIVLSILWGCDLDTKSNAPPALNHGDELIISEVFALPPDRFDSYSWIEMYNPSTDPIKWFGVQFPATGTAVGNNGTVIRSGASDVEWNVRNVGDNTPLSSIVYYNNDSVYAVGGHKIKKSSNGGVTWIDLPADSSYGLTMRSISMSNAFAFINPKLVVVCGDSGLIMVSSNRAAKWKRARVTKTNLHYAFVMSDQSTEWICGDSILLRSADYGTTWKRQLLPIIDSVVSFRCIKFASSTEARCVGSNGAIIYTSNASDGSLWQPETSNVAVTLNSLAYMTSNSGTEYAWAVGDGGTIIATNQAGPTQWYRLNSGTTANLHDVQFVDTLRGFVFGDGGLMLYTTDAGLTWKKYTFGTENLYAGAFLPSNDPLQYIVQNAYAIQLYGQKRQIFTDFSDLSHPIINADYYVGNADTSEIFLYPTFLPGYQPVPFNLSVDPGGFIVIYNDKARFDDHSKLPDESHWQALNFYLAPDTSGISGGEQYAKLSKWKLLTSSEVRLIKVYQKSTLNGQVVEYGVKTLDVIRYGGYNLSVDFPQNKPAPKIPDWWSLARYQDLMTTNTATFSTDKYFYLTNKPLPGWISQLRSH